ncbi:ParB/RepB/Spo0J family partition protein [Pseudoroseomonas ludipueritiae]|uniref:ParB/RepB/Spo0J family partition protein n=1 Tax=Pseudoroseomonas ludipueritiae TaxID=198093 RepID=A0ABR7RC25_9PROT|nr:ParB/RepB/Spo0J family partition protein [Pseudoroseomonas ludipueritiae]MBC9179223.1 ParB/RepB/Spo0J family partition protein [Pseudoroseomonas ludipueritiae]MCG7362141.1 ParB/RepB/Spo0J family partition protein [Roseomonas sp. ACRSG]
MSGRKPSRLGMGLSALLGDQPAQAASSIPRTLPVEALEPGPFQPRGPIDQSGLAELAASIREHGVLQPILVRPKPGAPGTYQIIGGERRWRASQLAQKHEVPVVIHELDDRAAMAASLVENLQREDLNALEEAQGYRRLTDEYGLTQEHLGRAVGKSRSHVANTLRLLGLPDKVREMLGRGSLSAGHARALLTSPDPVKLAEMVVTRGLNVRQTEALAAASERQRPAKAEDANTRALERDLTARLGLKVSVRHGNRGGQITIGYKDLDQLDSLIRLLNPS